MVELRRHAREERLIGTAAQLIYATIVFGTLFVMYKRPGAGVGLLLCTYGLEQWAQSQSAFFFVHGALTNVVTAAVVGIAILLQLRAGKPALQRWPKEYLIIYALYGLAVLSVVWSIYPTGTLRQLSGEAQYIGPFAMLMPLAIVDTRDLRDALFSMLTIGAFLCLLMLTTSQWTGRSIAFQTGNMITLDGIAAGNPLAVGNFGAYVALTAMLMNFRGAARFWQVLRWGIIGCGLAVTLKSGSRGQTLALLVAGLVFLPYSRRFRNLSSFIGFAGSLLVFAALSFLLFDSLTRDANAERNSRWTIDNAINTYQGSRVGTAGVVLAAYIASDPLHWLLGLGSSASFDPQVLGFYPHMVPAEAIAELGPAGLTLYLLVIYFAVRNLRQLWPLVRDDAETRGLIATVGGFTLFEVLITLKEGSLIGASTLFGVTAILGRVIMDLRIKADHAVDFDGYALNDADLAREYGDDDAQHADDLYDDEVAAAYGAELLYDPSFEPAGPA